MSVTPEQLTAALCADMTGPTWCLTCLEASLKSRTSAEVTVQRPLFASKETRSPWTSKPSFSVTPTRVAACAVV